MECYPSAAAYAKVELAGCTDLWPNQAKVNRLVPKLVGVCRKVGYADADRAVPSLAQSWVPTDAGWFIIVNDSSTKQTDPTASCSETVERWSSIKCHRVRETAMEK